MGQFLSVQHVNFTIDDAPGALDTARKFYVEVLGLEQLPRPENTDSGRPGLWLGIGQSGQQIHISLDPDATNHNEASRRHAAFLVNDLDAVHEKLVKAGARVDSANQFPGQRRFFCRDPFGNRIELVQLLDA
jgi:catechol 2,3-dioxygenase-like lactoylglutathione lyase family enzyme